MTPKQLTEQTIAAFAAWKKDPKTPIDRTFDNGGSWMPSIRPLWLDGDYRLAPFVLGSTINGHTLADGQEWHRSDGWKRKDFGTDRRPLLASEIGGSRSLDIWYRMGNHDTMEPNKFGWQAQGMGWLTTTRPLPSVIAPEHKPKTRAWDRAEDVPMPICWLRQGPNDHFPAFVIGFHINGVTTHYGQTQYTWKIFSAIPCEYSTDGKTFHPCTVPT